METWIFPQEITDEGHGQCSKFNKKVEFPHYYMKRQSNKIIGSLGINYAYGEVEMEDVVEIHP